MTTQPASTPSPTSRWPPPYHSAIAFTLDNLGEAQAVHAHTWPHHVGTHPSVTAQLPRMLSLLAKHRVRATYFIEAWSLGVYPSVVEALKQGGHEVAWHGWQHEVWSSYAEDAQGERGSFARSWEAAKRAGVDYEGAGFRPPGGRVNERTWGLLREWGAGYVSPAAGENMGTGADSGVGRGGAGIGREGVVVLPFEWKTVDAFWYMDKFARIRKGEGKREEALGPGEFGEWLMGRIEEVVESGGFLSVLFHPFLQTDEEKFALMEKVLKRIGEDGRIWVAPCKEIAEWVRQHPELFPAEPVV